MKVFHKNIIIFLSIIISIVVVDQITKVVWIDSHFSLIGDFIWIESCKNEGAAFSIFEGARWWFVAFSIPFLCAIFYAVFARKISEHPLFIVSMSLFFGGILGNLIDRIAFGYVRDFICFKFWPNFGIFNIADSALTIGCVLLAVFVLFFFIPKMSKDEKQKKLEAKAKKDETK